MEADVQGRYAEFSAGLHRRLTRGNPVPVNGTIEITRRCNLGCAHCYNNLPIGDESARSAELSRDEHLRILDEIAEAGCLWLLFTGGEIFARSDFLDIYTYAKKRGFLVTLFTNGTTLTPRIADHLAEWRPFSIEITLYGRTRETFEALTGVAGSFDRCMEGIRLSLDRRLPLKLKAVPVSLNRGEVFDMKRFAEEELGVEFRFDPMVNPRIDCSLGPLAVRLGPREIVELDLADPRRVAEWNRFADVFLGPPQPPDRTTELFHCGAGVHSFAIDPYGRLSLCMLSHLDLFDLRKGSFRDGWEGFLQRVRGRQITRPTKCTACELKSLCGMCPANGELTHGDPEAPVEFLCQVAHLRARAFGLLVKPHGKCDFCEGGARHEEIEETTRALRARFPGAPIAPGRPWRTTRDTPRSSQDPSSGRRGGESRGCPIDTNGPDARCLCTFMGGGVTDGASHQPIPAGPFERFDRQERKEGP